MPKPNKYAIITEDIKMDLVKVIAEVGFPIASAIAAGYFVFLTLKFILVGVTSSVKQLNNMITALDSRVEVMNHDIVRIDVAVCNALNIKPDSERIARANGKADARGD